MMDLPAKTRAITTPNDDGSYTIILNSRLSYEQQRDSYMHELAHIFMGDFTETDVDTVEKRIRGFL